MSDIPEPISADYFDNDLHEVNKEIVRLAFLLNIDITDQSVIDQLLEKTITDDHQHFHKMETLKGLILLRGHMRKERQESGLPDGQPPTEELAFKTLHNKS